MDFTKISRFAQQGLSMESFIRRPDRLIWPDDSNEAKKQFQDISKALSCIKKKRLFYSFAMSGAILSSRTDELLKAFQGLFCPSEIGLNLSWPQILSTKWLGIPLAVADGSDGLIIYAISGIGPDMQDNFAEDTRQWMGRDSQDAVRDAAKLASIHENFFFWLPGLFETKVTGTSLSLPVYIGFEFLKINLTIWPKIVCTGNLNAFNGTLNGTALGGQILDNKVQAARRYGFSGIVYPDNGQLPKHNYKDIELMPVTDLETAFALTKAYCPGMGRHHLFFLEQREDFQNCVDTVCTVDIALLNHLEQKEHYFSGQVLEIIRSNDTVRNKLISRLKEAIKEKHADHSRNAFLLKTLFPLDDVKNLIDPAPQDAFDVVRMHLQTDNHRGILKHREDWHELGLYCIESLSSQRDPDNELLLLGIYTLVGDLQNTYCFIPDKPNDIIADYSSTIADLKAKFTSRKANNAEAADETLGKYYGTLAQHYGFCGPDHLERTIDYCDLAQWAFGDGQNSAMRKEWKRIFSYRFFALLDAKMPEEALEALKSYLDISLSKLNYDSYKSIDEYGHFHLSRYLAETGEKVNGYETWCTDFLVNNNAGIKSQHPFQLWTLNMGKMLNHKENQKKYWKRSIAICTAGGPTMRMMGLMPLSLLYKHNLEQSGYIKHECQTILAACANSGLWQKHFEPLWTNNWKDVLERVYKNPARYFPFSYR